jgi:hypothetical protein
MNKRAKAKKPAKAKRHKPYSIVQRLIDISDSLHVIDTKQLIFSMRIDKLNDRINETNERLRVIEGDIGKIQTYVGNLAIRKEYVTTDMKISTGAAAVNIPPVIQFTEF